MNSIFSKRFLTNWAKFAVLRILLFSGSCSLFFGLAASADTNVWTVQNVRDVLAYLNRIDSYTQSNYSALGDIHDDLVGSYGIQFILTQLNSNSSYIAQDVADIESQVYAIRNALSADHAKDYNVLTNIYNELRRIYDNLPSGTGGGGEDILAANPWWATNSAFTFNYQKYSEAYPDDGVNNNYRYSFPQFLSLWSARLEAPKTPLTKAEPERNWYSYFGLSEYTNGWNANKARQRSFTWFDWMAEIQKTNLLWQAKVLSALRGISNSPVSGSSNLVSFEDVLAGNPWWATNSAFARNWQAYNLVYPTSEIGYSFPEAFSAFLAGRTTTAVSRRDLVDSFGLDGINQGHLYTFDDWLAEWLKSNMVLTTAISYSNLNSELAATDYTSDSTPTNTPLPGYRDFVADADTSDAESALSDGSSLLESKISSLSGRIGYGDAEIVLIPAMSVGGIQVREVRASLDSPITGVAHAICVFIWYVALFASLFSLATTEFAFYANLGRNWIHSDGFIQSKETGEYFN